MKYTSSKEIRTPVNNDSMSFLLKTLEHEFKKISKTVFIKKDQLEIRQLKRSFLGLEFRKDTSTIMLRPNTEKAGYIVEMETSYKMKLFFRIENYLLLLISVITDLVIFKSPILFLFFVGWFLLWDYLEKHIYNKDVSKMKIMINDTLTTVKQIVENEDKQKKN